MQREPILLTFHRFRDAKGQPTCSAGRGASCEFLASRKLGQESVCTFGWVDGASIERRGDDGLGTLAPIESCPMWGGR